MNDEWISSISYSTPNLFYSLDIRRVISSYLQLIASQCRSSKIIVRDILANIGSNQFFVPTMISSDTLNSQIDKITDEVKKVTISKQKRSRLIIQSANQQNQIASALGSNVLYRKRDYINYGFYFTS